MHEKKRIQKGPVRLLLRHRKPEKRDDLFHFGFGSQKSPFIAVVCKIDQRTAKVRVR
jgi:hypothetical protein